MRSAEEAAYAGISLLDLEAPGWRDNIDVENLDVGSVFLCPLAQTFGGYIEGCKYLSGLDWDFDDWASAHGFEAPVRGFGGDRFSDLNAAWKKLLS